MKKFIVAVLVAIFTMTSSVASAVEAKKEDAAKTVVKKADNKKAVQAQTSSTKKVKKGKVVKPK